MGEAMERNQITQNDLECLRSEDEMKVQHPFLPDVELRIRKDFRVENVLNQSVMFYGENYIVYENADPVRPKHDVLLSIIEAVAYFNELLTATTLSDMHYIRSLHEKGIQVDDIIEFEDEKKGVVIKPVGEGYPRNIQYVPLKNDGTKSKQRPRLIYPGMDYKLIGNLRFN